MAGKIYFLGGKLSVYEEEKLFDKYKPMLQSLVTSIGGQAGFKFIPITDCTRSKFAEIWSKPDTYGVFWFGHGTPGGLPATNESRPGGGNETLNPMLLGKSTRNLKFIAFLSCFSAGYRDEWIAKLGSVNTQVKTFNSTIEGGTGPLKGDIERWIANQSTLTVPTSGAAGLLHHAVRRSIWDVPTRAPLLISADHFGTDHAYVRSVIIPKVGSKPGLFKPPVLPTAKPSVVKPGATLAVSNWGIRKIGNKWKVGSPGPSSGKPGGLRFPGSVKKNDPLSGSSLEKRRKAKEQSDWFKKKSAIEAVKEGKLGKKPGGFRPPLWPPPKGGSLRPPRGNIDFGAIKIKFPGRTVRVPTPGW